MTPRAIIAGPVRRPKPGRQPRRYDCGSYGRMTREQIMAKTGLSRGAVWYRIGKLRLRGEALVDGTQAIRRTASVARTPSAVVACKLVAAYPHKAPTWRQVLAVVPMSEQAAKRWSRAMHAAREALPEEDAA